MYIYIYINIAHILHRFLIGPIDLAFSRDLRQLLAALVLPAAAVALRRLQALRRGGVAELFRAAQGAEGWGKHGKTWDTRGSAPRQVEKIRWISWRNH